MSKELLYATTNPGKLFEVTEFLRPNGISVVSPKDLSISIDVDEYGSSLEENAALKAKAFLNIKDNFLVMADDTGIEIDVLGGEPGIHVRRWKDGETRMTDQEIVEYCLKRLRGIPLEQRGAQFRTVIALEVPGKNIELFDGILRGLILRKPADIKSKEGFPFRALFFVPKWGKLLGEIHDLPYEEKGEYLTHRELAVRAALPRIKELL